MKIQIKQTVHYYCLSFFCLFWNNQLCVGVYTKNQLSLSHNLDELGWHVWTGKWLPNVAEFQEAFQLFDSRGDGKIHVAQIGDALRALGQNPTESDVKKCTLHLKPDERISFEVFLPIYQVRQCLFVSCSAHHLS